MKFNKDVGRLVGTHEAHAKLAEAWFTFLGFIAVVAVFHAAAEKTNDLSLVYLKWISYFLLFNWVYHKLCKLIWFVYPASDIENGKPNDLVLGISVWLSSMVMLFVYFLTFDLVEVFIKAAS